MQGKLVVLTRSAAGNRAWQRHFERLGASLYRFPTIEVVPVEPSPELTDILRRIDEFDWVIFTSAMGPHFFKSIIEKLSIDISPETMPPIAVIGERTAMAVKKIGYRVTFQPRLAASKNLAQELGDFKPIKGSAILLLRSAIAEPDFPKKLGALGGRVTDRAIYQTILVREPDPEFEKLLEQGKIDFLTFASPSAVRGFLGRVPSTLQEIAMRLPAIALGRNIANALRSAGFKHIIITKEATMKAMLEALLNAN